ncbi:hypothetical protein HK105_205482 [Polyrhizophydium stewartii]|uniref:EamA domain-containing protein n=1 Tax=Polyrhizophydium stewartii TaxID=2732419 RepID=A0ABR4N633_9FUNG
MPPATAPPRGPGGPGGRGSPGGPGGPGGHARSSGPAGAAAAAGPLAAAAVSGVLAALASVFSKLASNSAPASGGVVYSTLCRAVVPAAAAAAACSGSAAADAAALDDYNRIAAVVRVACVACVLLSNAAMWKTFTSALSRADASIHVTVINSAANMIVTGLCGLAVFGEPVRLQWWVGATLVVVGSILMGRSEHGGDAQQLRPKHE